MLSHHDVQQKKRKKTSSATKTKVRLLNVAAEVSKTMQRSTCFRSPFENQQHSGGDTSDADFEMPPKASERADNVSEATMCLCFLHWLTLL